VSIATLTTVASSANPATIAENVTFTATVTAASGSDAPTGTVQFKDGASDIGAPQPVTATATPGVGVATVTTSFAVGSRSITGTFVASGDFAGSSSAALTQQVGYAVALRSGKADMQKKAGAKLDMKLELDDAFGTNFSSPGLDVTAQCLIPAAATDCSAPGAVALNATFALNTTAKPYYDYEIVNPGLAGGSYALVFTATADPSPHRVTFNVKG
jgi:hypothetical protein